MENTALKTLESLGTITEKTLKRSLWEDMAVTVCADGEHVNVANRSYGNDGVGHTYTVTMADEVPSSCTCPHNTFHSAICKHMIFVARQRLVCAAAAAIQASGREKAEKPTVETLAGRRAVADGGAIVEAEEDVEHVVTGPHVGRDQHGRVDHIYWKCARCGMETCDAAVRESCWGCSN